MKKYYKTSALSLINILKTHLHTFFYLIQKSNFKKKKQRNYHNPNQQKNPKTINSQPNLSFPLKSKPHTSYQNQHVPNKNPHKFLSQAF